MRALPLLGYVVVARASRLRSRVSACIALAAIATGSVHVGASTAQLLAGSGAVLYIAALSAPVHWLARQFAEQRVTRGAVFASTAVVFLVLPGMCMPGALNMPFLTLGWEAMLAASSFVLDSGMRSGGTRSGLTTRDFSGPSRGDCAFFLVVNPMLIYPARGTHIDQGGWNTRAVGRIALGVAAMMLAIALALLGARAVETWLSARPQAEHARALPGYALFVVQGVYFFVGRYAALSGLASVQLGAMRLLGYRIPERYHYPFLAKSPSEFWQRWNTYVGEWFRRYVLVPIALHTRKRWPNAGRLGTVASAVATLLVVGVFHDLFGYLASLTPSLAGTVGFAFAAFSMIAWLLTRPPTWLSRIATAHAAFAVAWAMG